MSNPVIVSNSTPIILLQKIGRLDLMQKLYSKVYIAEAVYREVIIDGADKINRDDFISEYSWIFYKKNFAVKSLWLSRKDFAYIFTLLLKYSVMCGII